MKTLRVISIEILILLLATKASPPSAQFHTVIIKFSDHVHNFAPVNPTIVLMALYAAYFMNNPESTVELNVTMLVIGEN